MTIEITSVTVDQNNKTVEIEGTDLDQIFMNDDLSETFEARTVKFLFDLTKRGDWRYLYKFCKSQYKNEGATSMQEMLDNCVGLITSLNGNFIKKAA